MTIGKFDPPLLEDRLSDEIDSLTYNVAEWMKEYTHGSEAYPEILLEAQERDFDIIIQGAKVVDLLRQAQEAIEVLAAMADEVDKDEGE